MIHQTRMPFPDFCAWLAQELDRDEVPPDRHLDLVEDLELDSFDFTMLDLGLQDLTDVVHSDEPVPSTLGEVYDRYLQMSTT